ncbi:17729_t:CDS:2, partial [Entrophospora sp. SA101]
NNLTSDIFDNVSAAVTTLYKQLFPSSETKFSGPLIIGHDKPEINNQLLTDVIFCPFNCMYNKFTIFIYGIGVSSDDGMCNVVPKCLPEEWNIASKMEHLWNYHLRKCTLASEYEQHLVVTDRGMASHDICINHCLPYAFGECNASHTYA